MGDCEPRNFLQPCLLLLLRERSDHGYDLVNRLRSLHVDDGDAGAVYRALRGLERQGMVRSTWQTSEAGPARRTYQVTADGVAHLERLATVLEATHQTLHVFRERYRQLGDVAAGNGSAPSAGLPSPQEVNGNGRHDHGRPHGRGVRAAQRPGQRARR